MLWLFLAILTSGYCYVCAFKYGLSQRRWAFWSMLFGPMLLPVFGVSKVRAMRRAAGFGSWHMSA